MTRHSHGADCALAAVLSRTQTPGHRPHPRRARGGRRLHEPRAGRPARPRARQVLFDQRGCGASTPRGCAEANDMGRLAGDVERLREHLGVERWGLVLGGRSP